MAQRNIGSADERADTVQQNPTEKLGKVHPQPHFVWSTKLHDIMYRSQ